jgi:hypothetical protein
MEMTRKEASTTCLARVWLLPLEIGEMISAMKLKINIRNSIIAKPAYVMMPQAKRMAATAPI